MLFAGAAGEARTGPRPLGRCAPGAVGPLPAVGRVASPRSGCFAGNVMCMHARWSRGVLPPRAALPRALAGLNTAFKPRRLPLLWSLPQRVIVVAEVAAGAVSGAEASCCRCCLHLRRRRFAFSSCLAGPILARILQSVAPRCLGCCRSGSLRSLRVCDVASAGARLHRRRALGSFDLGVGLNPSPVCSTVGTHNRTDSGEPALRRSTPTWQTGENQTC